MRTKKERWAAEEESSWYFLFSRFTWETGVIEEKEKNAFGTWIQLLLTSSHIRSNFSSSVGGHMNMKCNAFHFAHIPCLYLECPLAGSSRPPVTLAILRDWGVSNLRVENSANNDYHDWVSEGPDSAGHCGPIISLTPQRRDTVLTSRPAARGAVAGTCLVAPRRALSASPGCPPTPKPQVLRCFQRKHPTSVNTLAFTRRNTPFCRQSQGLFQGNIVVVKMWRPF